MGVKVDCTKDTQCIPEYYAVHFIIMATIYGTDSNYRTPSVNQKRQICKCSMTYDNLKRTTIIFDVKHQKKAHEGPISTNIAKSRNRNESLEKDLPISS